MECEQADMDKRWARRSVCGSHEKDVSLVAPPRLPIMANTFLMKYKYAIVRRGEPRLEWELTDDPRDGVVVVSVQDSLPDTPTFATGNWR